MKLNWGKPRIIVRKCSDVTPNPNPFIEFPTPVQSSTVLDTTKGDKTEAKVEGGENEDVRYNRNTYALTTRIRTLKNRLKPILDDDGIIPDEYEVYVQPEDPTAVGMFMARSTASEADQFNADDGGAWEYVFDALKNPETGKGQVQWGIVTITESGGSITGVTFTPAGAIGATPNVLLFSEDASASGIDVAVTETGVTATPSENWCTTSVAGKVVKVKVQANSTTSERACVITLAKGSDRGYISVKQEAGSGQ